jgi:hypothetical protein
MEEGRGHPTDPSPIRFDCPTPGSSPDTRHRRLVLRDLSAIASHPRLPLISASNSREFHGLGSAPPECQSHHRGASFRSHDARHNDNVPDESRIFKSPHPRPRTPAHTRAHPRTPTHNADLSSGPSRRAPSHTPDGLRISISIFFFLLRNLLPSPSPLSLIKIRSYRNYRYYRRLGTGELLSLIFLDVLGSTK